MSKPERKPAGNRKVKKPKPLKISDFNLENYFKATPEDMQWLKSTRKSREDIPKRRKNKQSLIDLEEPRNIMVSVSAKGRQTVEYFREQSCLNCQKPVGNFNSSLYRAAKAIGRKPRMAKTAKILHQNLNFDEQHDGDSDLSFRGLMKVIKPPLERTLNRNKAAAATASASVAPKGRRAASRNKKLSKRSTRANKLTLDKAKLNSEEKLAKMVSSASTAAVTALTKTLECCNALETMGRKRIIIISSDTDSSSDEGRKPKTKKSLITRTVIKTENDIISVKSQESVKAAVETDKEEPEEQNEETPIAVENKEEEKPNDNIMANTAEVQEDNGECETENEYLKQFDQNIASSDSE